MATLKCYNCKKEILNIPETLTINSLTYYFCSKRCLGEFMVSEGEEILIFGKESNKSKPPIMNQNEMKSLLEKVIEDEQWESPKLLKCKNCGMILSANDKGLAICNYCDYKKEQDYNGVSPFKVIVEEINEIKKIIDKMKSDLNRASVVTGMFTPLK